MEMVSERNGLSKLADEQGKEIEFLKEVLKNRGKENKSLRKKISSMQAEHKKIGELVLAGNLSRLQQLIQNETSDDQGNKIEVIEITSEDQSRKRKGSDSFPSRENVTKKSRSTSSQSDEQSQKREPNNRLPILSHNMFSTAQFQRQVTDQQLQPRASYGVDNPVSNSTSSQAGILSPHEEDGMKDEPVSVINHP